jgi:hypothetical protein
MEYFEQRNTEFRFTVMNLFHSESEMSSNFPDKKGLLIAALLTSELICLKVFIVSSIKFLTLSSSETSVFINLKFKFSSFSFSKIFPETSSMSAAITLKFL